MVDLPGFPADFGVLMQPQAQSQPVDDLAWAAAIIASMESAGSGDYAARGPAQANGNQALGRYQVMASNVPSWTQQHLGRSLTPDEFLADPAAQDAVFNGQFGSYLNQHGPASAASMWFTGRPNAPNARDSLGTSGNTYVNRFMSQWGNQSQAGARPMGILEDMFAQPPAGVGAATQPTPVASPGQPTPPPPSAGDPQGGWAAYLSSPDVRSGLISAGLQMMTGGWGNNLQQLGTALGQGATAVNQNQIAREASEQHAGDVASRERLAASANTSREAIGAARNETSILRASIAAGARNSQESRLYQTDVSTWLTQARANVANISRNESELMAEAQAYAQQQMERRRVQGEGAAAGNPNSTSANLMNPQAAPVSPSTGYAPAAPISASNPTTGEHRMWQGTPTWMRRMFGLSAEPPTPVR